MPLAARIGRSYVHKAQEVSCLKNGHGLTYGCATVPLSHRFWRKKSIVWINNRLIALLAVLTFSLLVAAWIAGMQFQLWLLNERILGVSFWGAVGTVLFGGVGLLNFLWRQLKTTKP